MVQQIRKRDGRQVPFHESKIADAINKAFQATYKPGYEETAARLACTVEEMESCEKAILKRLRNPSRWNYIRYGIAGWQKENSAIQYAKDRWDFVILLLCVSLP